MRRIRLGCDDAAIRTDAILACAKMKMLRVMPALLVDRLLTGVPPWLNSWLMKIRNRHGLHSITSFTPAWHSVHPAPSGEDPDEPVGRLIVAVTWKTRLPLLVNDFAITLPVVRN